MKQLVGMLLVALALTGLVACGDEDDDSAATDTATTPAASEQNAPTSKTDEGTAAANNDEFPLLDDQVGDSHVTYAANPDGGPAYFVALASASAGKATIEFVNPQSVPHNVSVEAPSGKTIGATKTIKKGTAKTSVVLKPGEYVIYCSVPGHRKAGMLGHLTVQ